MKERINISACRIIPILYRLKLITYLVIVFKYINMLFLSKIDYMLFKVFDLLLPLEH